MRSRGSFSNSRAADRRAAPETPRRAVGARTRWHQRRAARRAAGLLGLAAAWLLAGCATEEGAGALIVDPGQYSAYHCNDLANQAKGLAKRERDLRGLMEKANESAGGELVSAIAYRTDYEKVLTQQKLVQRVAAEKKCELAPPSDQSDGTVR